MAMGMVVHLVLRVGIVSCTLYAECSESLKSLARPIVVLEMRLVYGTHYDIDHLIMLLIITCHSFNELYALLCKYTNTY
jgi:hypothetical protein